MNFTTTTLYTWDRNKVRVWTIEVRGSQNNARIVTEFGFLNGEMDEKVTEVVGKNFNRSNETTSLQQAVKQAASMLSSKLKEGYKRAADFNFDTPTGKKYDNGLPQAMLLYEADVDWIKRTDKKKRYKITYPVFVQEKLDGVFAAATAEHGLISRGGELGITKGGQLFEEIFPELTEQVKKFCKYIRMGDIVLNGELYCPGYTLQEITSACKKRNYVSPKLKFHIFDVYFQDYPDTHQNRRIQVLHDLHEILESKKEFDKIKILQPEIAADKDDILNIENRILEKGGEGLVVRNSTGVYTPGKRSRDVLKVVRADVTTVPIVDIIPMEKEPTQGVFICVYNGKRFKVTPSEYTHKERSELLLYKHRYINKTIQIQHRGFTDDGIPRIAKAIRTGDDII
jgi:hypothetical protein